MGRRIGLGLLVAAALLVAPNAAATVASARPERDHQSAAHAVADRHATAAPGAARTAAGRERRASHHPSAAPGVLAVAHGTPRLTWAHLDALVSSPDDEVGASSRPRAPPAVV